MARYKSRARRAQETADNWRQTAQNLREIAEQVEDENGVGADERRKAEEKIVIEMAAELGVEADTLEALESHKAFDREDYDRRVNDEVGETLTPEEAVAKARTVLDTFDPGEVESLAEEMRSWADNMSGTGLENTEKYGRIEEAADTLEGIDTDAPEIDEADDIDEAADELESRADELEAVEFPGMYG